MNSGLCWVCNIIIYLFIYSAKLWAEKVGRLHNGGCWVPEIQIFMLRSLLADRLHDTQKDTPEQIGRSTWLGLDFTFHPTVFSALVTYPFQPTTLSSKSSEH